MSENSPKYGYDPEGRTVVNYGFHIADHLYVKRLDNGDVQLTKLAYNEDQKLIIIFQQVIERAAWVNAIEFNKINI